MSHGDPPRRGRRTNVEEWGTSTSTTATATHVGTVADLYTAGKVATFRHIGDLAREEIPFRG